MKKIGGGGRNGREQPDHNNTANKMSDKIFPMLEIFEKNSKVKRDYHAEFYFDEKTKELKKIAITLK